MPRCGRRRTAQPCRWPPRLRPRRAGSTRRRPHPGRRRARWPASGRRAGSRTGSPAPASGSRPRAPREADRCGMTRRRGRSVQGASAPPIWNTSWPAGQSRVEVKPPSNTVRSVGGGGVHLVGGRPWRLVLLRERADGDRGCPADAEREAVALPSMNGMPSTPTIVDQRVRVPPGTSTHSAPRRCRPRHPGSSTTARARRRMCRSGSARDRPRLPRGRPSPAGGRLPEAGQGARGTPSTGCERSQSSGCRAPAPQVSRTRSDDVAPTACLRRSVGRSRRHRACVRGRLADIRYPARLVALRRQVRAQDPRQPEPADRHAPLAPGRHVPVTLPCGRAARARRDAG